MKAYRVYRIDKMGYDDNVCYYTRQKDAERDFYNRVREGIADYDLASEEDQDDARPWKINQGHPFKMNIVLSAYFNYWDSYQTDCGLEYDIDRYEVCLEEIEIS